VVGVGAAAVVAGVILYPIGAGKVSTAESECPTRSACSASATDEGNSGRRLESAGVITGVAGLALVGGGLAWHFLEKPKEGATPTQGKLPHLQPAVAPNYAGLSLGGQF
jgi:hypothetical protein